MFAAYVFLCFGHLSTILPELTETVDKVSAFDFYQKIWLFNFGVVKSSWLDLMPYCHSAAQWSLWSLESDRQNTNTSAMTY